MMELLTAQPPPLQLPAPNVPTPAGQEGENLSSQPQQKPVFFGPGPGNSPSSYIPGSSSGALNLWPGDTEAAARFKGFLLK